MLQNFVNNLSNFEAEQVVLGSLLVEKNLYYSHADLLFEEMFSNFGHRCIFKAIKEVVVSGHDVDMITVNQQCNNAGYHNLIKKDNPEWRGVSEIMTLTSRIASTAHFESHVDILIGYWQLRKIHRMALEVGQKCITLEDPKEIIDSINNELVELININDNDFDKNEILKESTDSMKASSIQNMIPSGIYNLDRFIFGFEYGDLIIIAGAASMGKTAFALRLLLNFIERGLYPAYFSLEMSAAQLVSRLLAMLSNVSLSTIRKRALSEQDWIKMHQATARLEQEHFVIDDKSGRLNQIANKIRKYAIKHGTKVFFIDYLQLIKVDLGKKSTREQEVAAISRTLKELCRDLKVVIFALSQLNREVGKRGNTRPQLSDLRESGAIEQDADMVMFPYRQAYYDTFEKTIPYQEDATLIIAKGRGTGLSDIPLQFISSRTNYLNGSSVDSPQTVIEDIQFLEDDDEQPF